MRVSVWPDVEILITRLETSELVVLTNQVLRQGALVPRAGFHPGVAFSQKDLAKGAMAIRIVRLGSVAVS